MTKILSTIILLAILQSGCKKSIRIKVLEVSLEEALLKAKEENKCTFVLLGYDDCSLCSIFSENVFSNNNVADLMNDKYIINKIDCSKPENYYLSHILEIHGFPSFIVFNPKGEIQYLFEGYTTVNDFLDKIQNGIETKITDNYRINLHVKDSLAYQVYNNTLKSYNIIRNNYIVDSLNTALNYALSSLNIEPYFCNLYLISKIYQASRDSVKAKLYAEKALKFNSLEPYYIYAEPIRELKQIINHTITETTQNHVLFFDKIGHDFSEISPRKDAICTFTCTNFGDTPPIIHDIITSCSCTTNKWGKSPIMPGKSRAIEITFAPRSEDGVFQKNISVIANDNIERYTLTVKGAVTS
ncbi:MAG: DUF1573 domain-containing protein [Bacteroidales bacterium]